MKGLYLVTPNWSDTDRMLAITEEALHAGVAMVQYRNKDADKAMRREQGAALLALCRRYGRPMVVNDHISLCVTLDADGVHLGGTDDAVAMARVALGPDKIIGASCYGQLQLARDAERDGASYVAFGGFYPSLVKKYTFVTDPSLVSEAKAELKVPMVVIGGMTPANAAPLVARGADMVAAITSVYQAADPRAAAGQFDALFVAA